jgi:hypothetical protein
MYVTEWTAIISLNCISQLVLIMKTWNPIFNYCLEEIVRKSKLLSPFCKYWQNLLQMLTKKVFPWTLSSVSTAQALGNFRHEAGVPHRGLNPPPPHISFFPSLCFKKINSRQLQWVGSFVSICSFNSDVNNYTCTYLRIRNGKTVINDKRGWLYKKWTYRIEGRSNIQTLKGLR